MQQLRARAVSRRRVCLGWHCPYPARDRDRARRRGSRRRRIVEVAYLFRRARGRQRNRYGCLVRHGYARRSNGRRQYRVSVGRLL
uniref:Uncharacterized protein n=1 Tax=uncultured marine virus TaxID=186617 RepID=A0A0F7L3S6_9VIRU|nr:hypothetical protein [uncultured marine virus]